MITDPAALEPPLGEFQGWNARWDSMYQFLRCGRVNKLVCCNSPTAQGCWPTRRRAAGIRSWAWLQGDRCWNYCWLPEKAHPANCCTNGTKWVGFVKDKVMVSVFAWTALKYVWLQRTSSPVVLFCHQRLFFPYSTSFFFLPTTTSRRPLAWWRVGWLLVVSACTQLYFQVVGVVLLTACSYCLGKGQHRRIALGMVHNRNKSAIGTCIPDVIGIMFFRDMPQQVSFIISEVSFALTLL